MFATIGEYSHQYLPTIRIHCSTFFKTEQIFSLPEAILNYIKTHVSPHDPTNHAIHSILRPQDDPTSNCGENIRKTVSLYYIALSIDDENIVTFVDNDCGITVNPGKPTKIRLINEISELDFQIL